MTTQAHDARLVYAVWQRLITDEALCDAVIDNRLGEGEPSAQLDPDELAIARAFGADPGFRWAVENLRYRATTMVVRNLEKRMPVTARLLTGGNEDWLWDLASEYLGRHGWRDLGHRYNAECLRFGEFVTRQVARRRVLGDACMAALAYESGILSVLVRASEQDGWPAMADGGRGWRPRRNPNAVIVDLPVDLVAWLGSGDGPPVPASQAPVALVMYMPVVDRPVQIERLDGADKAILNAVSGRSTLAELISEIGEREGIDPAAVEHALHRWQRSGLLM
jgi:hypothetical protein